MADILIRNVPEEVVARLDHRAKAVGQSRNEYLVNLISDYVADDFDPGICLGWIKLDRFGDLDPADGTPATCQGHGGEIEGPIWMAVMGDGRLSGPYCDICATSE